MKSAAPRYDATGRCLDCGGVGGCHSLDCPPMAAKYAEAERSAASPQPEYQIALRCDDLGLDDVVVKDVQMFRMERMDNDHVWLACYLNDGQDIHFDLWLEGRTVKYAARELPSVVYEEGSASGS